MNAPARTSLAPQKAAVFARIDALMPELEKIYIDLHKHPELSMQEIRTAGIAAAWLDKHGFEVHPGVGKTGVVGLLKNGDGPVILLRADMDGLPVKEKTGLPFASEQTGTDRFGQSVSIMHACGHDFHVTWLMAVCKLLSEARDTWKGTVMAVFQPAEETGAGARAMLEDGMVKRFPKPTVSLGQHVIPLPAGRIGYSLSNTEAGWIAGIYYLGYMLLVTPAVMLTDRIDARLIFIVGSAVTGVSTLAFAAFADDFWSGLLLRAIGGAGQAAVYMPGLRALTDRLKGGEQSRAVTFYTASYSIAISLSFNRRRLSHRL